MVCFLLVDKIHHEHPTLGKDVYWENTTPSILPFTIASQEYMSECPEWSTENMQVKNTEQDFLIPTNIYQSDELHKRDGRQLWKRLFAKRGSDVTGFQLKSVGGYTDRNDIDEVNNYEKCGPNRATVPPLNKPSSQQVSDDFNKLREERLRKRKEKLLKCIELLKLDDKRREELLEDIIK